MMFHVECTIVRPAMVVGIRPSSTTINQRSIVNGQALSFTTTMTAAVCAWVRGTTGDANIRAIMTDSLDVVVQAGRWTNSSAAQVDIDMYQWYLLPL